MLFHSAALSYVTFSGAVLSDTVFTLKRGKTHQNKQWNHNHEEHHRDLGPISAEDRSSVEGLWNDSEDRNVASPQDDGYSRVRGLPTFRLIRRGRLLPPLIEHAIPNNLSEDESIEPVTICGPGWRAPFVKHPSERTHAYDQQAQMSFSGVQFFFGNAVPLKSVPASSLDDGDDDILGNGQPTENNDAPLIVT